MAEYTLTLDDDDMNTLFNWYSWCNSEGSATDRDDELYVRLSNLLASIPMPDQARMQERAEWASSPDNAVPQASLWRDHYARDVTALLKEQSDLLTLLREARNRLALPCTCPEHQVAEDEWVVEFVDSCPAHGKNRLPDRIDAILAAHV